MGCLKLEILDQYYTPLKVVQGKGESTEKVVQRWLSVDPMTYPWQSSYATFNNNPIIYVDPYGLYGSRKEARAQRKNAKKAGYTVGDVYKVGKGKNKDFGFGAANDSEYFQSFNKSTWATGSVSGPSASVESTDEYHGIASAHIFKADGQWWGDYFNLNGEFSFAEVNAYNGSGKGSVSQYAGLSLDLGADASVLKGGADLRLGTENFNLKGGASGKLLAADANFNGGILSGEKKRYGYILDANAGAYVAVGEVQYGGTFLGIETTFTVGASAYSAHAGATYALFYNQKTGKLHFRNVAHLGLGVGVKEGLDVAIPIKWIWE